MEGLSSHNLLYNRLHRLGQLLHHLDRLDCLLSCLLSLLDRLQVWDNGLDRLDNRGNRLEVLD